MINRYFIPVINLSILLVLQLTLVEIISFKNFKPDFLIIGLIYFTLRYGQIPGIIGAFFFGLLLDLFSGGVVGANSLSKVIATFLTGFFSQEESERFDISINFFVIVFFMTLIERIVYIFVAINLDFKSLLIVLVNNGLVPSLVTLIFSLLVLLLPRKSEIS